MCPHDEFEILKRRDDGIVVRRCKQCGQIGIRCARFVGLDELLQILKEIAGGCYGTA